MEANASHRSRVKVWLLGVLTLLGLTLGGVIVAYPVSAAPPVNYMYKNVGTQYCLDGGAGGDVYTNPCNSKNGFQRWDTAWGPDKPGTIVLQGQATSRRLQAHRNTFRKWDWSVDTTDVRNARDSNQQWYWTKEPLGYVMKNVSNNECLEATTKQDLVTSQCDPNNRDQHWVR